MPQLSKAQFAALVQSMPGASDDEVLAAAKKAEAGPQEEPSLWERLNAPLTNVFSRGADKVADAVDQPRLNRSPLEAQLEGFGAGVAQGAGKVADSLTSPVNLALTALGVGGEAAGARGLLGISRAARAGEAALQAPMVAEGVKNAVSGVQQGDYGKAGAGAVEAALGGTGMKGALTHSFPVQKVAEAYNESVGLPAARAAAHTPVKVNPDEAKAVADAYQAMPHTPNDPETQKAYQSLANEIENQFGFITNKAGVKMEPWQGQGQPYANSTDMMADVKNNNHLFYFPSEGGFGAADVAQSDHPLAAVSPKYGVPYNDLFRAVHDYFGHAKEGFQFGPSGEENAWLSHQGTLSDQAIPALTSETRGQNSWVNYGQHLRDAEGNLPSKGQPGFVPPQDRPFADQKAGLLPAEFRQRADAAQSSPTAPAGQATSEAAGLPSAVETGSQNAPGLASDQTQGALPSKPVYQPQDAASIVADLTSKNGGSTFNLYKGDLIGTPHYAVSAYPERADVIQGKATPEQIGAFVQKNADLLQDPKNSIGTWFNKADGKTYLDISVTTPDIKEAATLGKAKNQIAIYNLQNFDEIGLQPHPNAEFTPVGEEPEYQRPTFKDPMQGIQDKIAQSGGRDLQRVAQEQAQRGVTPGLATAMSIAGPAAAAALPDDSDNPLVQYGKVGLNLAGLAGLGMAAARSSPLTGEKLFAAHGAGMMLAGVPKRELKERLLQAGAAEDSIPRIVRASQKMLDQQVQKAGGQLTNAKKLMAAFKSGQADMSWYDSTHQELQDIFGADADKMAGFLTATSINSTVKSNVTLALKAYSQWKAGESFSGFLPAAIQELDRVVADQPLAGRKLDNFRRALTGDTDAVVVDRWMLRAFGFDKDAATPKQYDVIEHTVKELAQQAGVTPRQMQAAIWFSTKNKAEAARGVVNAAPPFEQLLRQKMAQKGLPFASGQ